jgi:hypothetical protein
LLPQYVETVRDVDFDDGLFVAEGAEAEGFVVVVVVP